MPLPPAIEDEKVHDETARFAGELTRTAEQLPEAVGIDPGKTEEVLDSVADHRREFPGKPASGGHRKADFAPRNNGLRKQRRDGVPENPLRLPLMEAKMIRKGGGELDEAVVEKGDAEFNRGGHRHFVGVQEEMVGQPGC